jgi:hypothetical protein
MKVFEMKAELEKVAKFIPELREGLDEAYKAHEGKKSKIKLLRQQYGKRHDEMRDSKQFEDLHLH